jgi:carboxyl-terminal processing protease
VLNQYVVGYFDKNQKVLKVKYPNFDAFEKGFTVTDAMMNDLRAAAEKDSIKIDAEQYAKSAPLIKTQIKALVARDLFTTSDYFRVINNASDSYRKALELINDEKAYRKLLERK